MKSIKYSILGVLVIFNLSVFAQVDSTKVLELMSAKWEPYKMNTSLVSIESNYETIKKEFVNQQTDADKMAFELNELFFIKSLSRHIKRQGEFNETDKPICNKIQKLDFKAPIVSFSVSTKPLSFVTKDYFFLKHLLAGEDFRSATGGGKINTSMLHSFNDLYYQDLMYVYEEGSEQLKQAYLPQIGFVFRFYGYTEGLDPILPLIKAMSPSESRDELIQIYEKYNHLRVGKPAPDFKLPDDRGNIHTLADFKGKVLVIDVWATWCAWCIKKMPKYLEVYNKYKTQSDIAFVSISIDKFNEYSHWKYSLPHYNMMELTNMIASEEKTDFIEKYNITGAPRYMVIGKDGKIVNVYTPGPGGAEFEDTIIKALEK
ncbi:MAG: TlpA disulfide reductase family protein [Bacteroidota bacterium]